MKSNPRLIDVSLLIWSGALVIGKGQVAADVARASRP